MHAGQPEGHSPAVDLVWQCIGCYRFENQKIKNGPRVIKFNNGPHGPGSRSSYYELIPAPRKDMLLPGEQHRHLSLCTICQQGFRDHYRAATDHRACPARHPCPKCATIFGVMQWVHCRHDGCTGKIDLRTHETNVWLCPTHQMAPFESMVRSSGVRTSIWL